MSDDTPREGWKVFSEVSSTTGVSHILILHVRNCTVVKCPQCKELQAEIAHCSKCLQYVYRSFVKQYRTKNGIKHHCYVCEKARPSDYEFDLEAEKSELVVSPAKPSKRKKKR